MEFPAVSQTRIEFWGKPQYTRNGMLILTVVLGFFGVHHLMLRSPQTALVMLIANFMLMGYPWLYDIIQLLPESWGGLGVEKLNKYGMGHAFGSLGLAQGMWLPDESLIPKSVTNAVGMTQAGGGNLQEDPPSPLWFIAYCVFFPITFLAVLLGGDMWGAFAKFGFLTFIPLGWVLTIIASAYDLFYLFVKPADLFVFGLKRFFPWTLFGMDKDGHSKNITGVRSVPTCPPQGNFLTNILDFFLRLLLPVLWFINPAAAMSVEQGLSSAATGVGTVGSVAEAFTASAQKVSDAAIATADIAADTASAVVRDGSKVFKTVGKLSEMMDGINPATLAAKTTDLAKQHAMAQMKGGGDSSSFSIMDYVAFGGVAALLGGGFLLTAGRSLFPDVNSGPSDTPPNARGI